jgi:hypothetical protein
MMNNNKNNEKDGVDCSSVCDDNSVRSVDAASRDNVTTNAIGTKETKDVNRLRLAVLFVIFLSAVLVGFLVFFITRREEMTKFHEAFDAETLKIYTSIGDGLKRLVGSLDSFSTLAVSYARSTNSTWPFVTIPDFPNHASKMLSNGVGNTLIMSVIVTPANRLLWEQYSMNNSNIIPEALQLMATDKNYYGDTNRNYTLTPVVVNASVDFPPIPYDTT